MKKKKLLWIIIAVVLVIATVGVSVGSCYFMRGSKNQTEDETTTAEDTSSAEESSEEETTGIDTGDGTYYEVSFDDSDEDVWVPDTMMLKEGTEIYTITTPEKDGCIFLAWYYDADFTELAEKDDTVDKNMKLYPRFTEQGGDGDTDVHMDYVASQEVATDFAITVEAYDLTEEEIKALISVTNLTTNTENVSYVLKAGESTPKDLEDLTDEEETVLEDTFEQLGISRSDLTYQDQAGLEKALSITEDENLVSYMREQNITEDAIAIVAKAYHFDADSETESEEVYALTSRYTIEPATEGWEAGSLYQVTLSDATNLRYIYLDQTMDDKVTYYNFTVYEEEIDNLKLADDVIFIPASEITGVDPTKGMFNITTDENGDYLAEHNNTSGQANYTGSLTLKEGDKLAVYDGTLKDDRTVDGEVTYITITSAPSNNTFDYAGAEYDEVMKKADVIPVCDDGSFDDGKILIPAAELDFSEDYYQEMGLSADTVVEEGDYVAVYKGDFADADNMSLVGYGCITKATESADGIQVEYNEVTYEDVQSAMDLYMVDKNPELGITDEDLEELEDEVESDVASSGYLESLGEEVGYLVTDNSFDSGSSDYSDLFENAKFTAEDGTEMSLEEVRKVASGGKVEVKNPTVTAMLTTKLEHFSGCKGVRAELSAGLEIDINLNQTGSKQNKLVINLTAAFEQEVTLGTKLSSKVVWKKKWIFPYIYDIQVTAGLTAGTFTGIGLYATVKTQSTSLSSDKSWSELMDTTNSGLDMGNSNVKKVTDKINTLTSKLDAFSKSLKLSNGIGVSKEKGSQSETGAASSSSAGAGGGLMDKYSGMLANDAEYVRLIDKPLLDQEISLGALHLVALRLHINLVVSFKINAMIGFTVSYGNAKQYAYTFKVRSGTVTRAEADLETPNFRMDFYVFGMIGVRAGVELGIHVGIISTKLDSVGVKLEIGFYIEFYGFFYYALSWQSGKGTSTEMYGSLLVEIGVYLTVNFYTQLGNGKLSKTIPLYSVRWPLVSWGTQTFPIDFTIGENDKALSLTLAGNNTAVVPASLYKITGMALSSGKESTFNISGNDVIMTTSAKNLKYDGYSKKFIYTPTVEDYKSGKVEMTATLTYKNKAFGINSTAISRTVKITWNAPTVTVRLCTDRQMKNVIYSFTVKAGQNPSLTADQMREAFRKANPGKDIGTIYWYKNYVYGGKNYAGYLSYEYLYQPYYSDSYILTSVVPMTYTVEYYVDGEKVETKTGLAYNSKLPTPSELTKEGSVLTEWTDENGKAVDFANTLLTSEKDTIKIYSTWHTHTWGEETVITPATCIATGTAKHTCTECGAEETVELAIDPGNHAGETSVINAKEATCTETGYTGDTICKDCGETIETGKAIAKTGHTWGEDILETPATCIATGTSRHVCSVCGIGEVTIIPIDPTNHTGKTKVVNKKAATCTAEGYTGDTVCADCGAVITKGSVIAATGHDYQNPVFNWSADGKTCTVTYTCSIDNKKETFKCTVTSKVKKAATCTAKGTTTYTATYGSDKSTKDVVDIAAKGHNYKNPVFTWATNGKTCKVTYTCANDSSHKVTYSCTVTSKVKKAATCTDKGITTYTATYGSDKATKDVEDIPASGNEHKWDSGTKCVTLDGDYNVTAAYTKYTCTLCGDVKKGSSFKITPVIYGAEAFCTELLTNNYFESIADLEMKAEGESSGSIGYLWASVYVGGTAFENRIDINGTFTFLGDYSKYTQEYFESHPAEKVTLKVRFTPEDTTIFNSYDFTVTFNKNGSTISDDEGTNPIGTIVGYTDDSSTEY